MFGSRPKTLALTPRFFDVGGGGSPPQAIRVRCYIVSILTKVTEALVLKVVSRVSTGSNMAWAFSMKGSRTSLLITLKKFWPRSRMGDVPLRIWACGTFLQPRTPAARTASFVRRW